VFFKLRLEQCYGSVQNDGIRGGEAARYKVVSTLRTKDDQRAGPPQQRRFLTPEKPPYYRGPAVFLEKQPYREEIQTVQGQTIFAGKKS
jgi:hypothetical protein